MIDGKWESVEFTDRLTESNIQDAVARWSKNHTVTAARYNSHSYKNEIPVIVWKQEYCDNRKEDKMNVFEVGSSYECADTEYDPIEILRRTEKTIWVTNCVSTWAMRVRHDDSGEYAIDSTAGKRLADTFTYRACWKVE